MTGSRRASSMAHSSPSRHWYVFLHNSLLVESNSDNPIIHRVEYRIIRADRIEKHASVWRDADIIVFNSYLWWRKQKDDMRMKVM